MLTRREAQLGLLSAAVLAAAPASFAGTEPETFPLPPPRSTSDRLLLVALKQRRSTREFSAQALPPQVLSDLLWAAFGVNRPASGDRTAPSWRHSIEIELYLAMANGVWRYEPRAHALLSHLRQDLRAGTGSQDFVAGAPLNLVYVADGALMHGASRDDQRLYASTDTGFIGQNVYLFCAAEGLATVFRGSVDRDVLGRQLALPPTKFVTYAQTVGYPKS